MSDDGRKSFGPRDELITMEATSRRHEMQPPEPSIAQNRRKIKGSREVARFETGDFLLEFESKLTYPCTNL